MHYKTGADQHGNRVDPHHGPCSFQSPTNDQSQRKHPFAFALQHHLSSLVLSATARVPRPNRPPYCIKFKQKLGSELLVSTSIKQPFAFILRHFLFLHWMMLLQPAKTHALRQQNAKCCLYLHSLRGGPCLVQYHWDNASGDRATSILSPCCDITATLALGLTPTCPELWIWLFKQTTMPLLSTLHHG